MCKSSVNAVMARSFASDLSLEYSVVIRDEEQGIDIHLICANIDNAAELTKAINKLATSVETEY